MSLLEALAIFAAGLTAGTINTVVGSGSLVTFPVLLAFGYPPVTANVSNTIGLVPGGLSGVVGYRRELVGQRERVIRLGTMSLLGAIIGATALLALPDEAFDLIVPFFIAAAVVLVVLQPWLAERIGRRHRNAAAEPELDESSAPGPVVSRAVLATGVYGGYFGAAQGVLLLAILGLALPGDLQRINALKNVLATLANLVAGVMFAILADVAWGPAALIAAGSIVGGQVGARIGRRLPPPVLRAVIVVVGVAAIVRLVTS